MKKFIKTLLAISMVAMCIDSFNSLIFTLAGALVPTKHKERVYKWRFGNIRYIVCGSGSPVLLVHSLELGFSLAEFEQNIDTLSEHHTVYAFDFLGFGQSDKPNLTYSPYLYVTLINDFIKDVIGKKTCVVASEKAASYVMVASVFEPDNIGKMLLVSPCGVDSSNSCTQTNKSKLANFLFETPVFGTLVYNFVASKYNLRCNLQEFAFYNINNEKNLVDKLNKSAHLGEEKAKYVAVALAKKNFDIDIRHTLKDVKSPIKIVWGDANRINPLKNYHAFNSACENVSLEVFPKAKSLAHVEYANKFNEIAVDFFA